MEVLHERYHYKHEIPEEFILQISQFVLLPAVDSEPFHQVTGNENNVQSGARYSDCNVQENCTQPSTNSTNLILVTTGKGTKETVSENYSGMARAKR